jgi:hypothetical protein
LSWLTTTLSSGFHALFLGHGRMVGCRLFPVDRHADHQAGKALSLRGLAEKSRVTAHTPCAKRNGLGPMINPVLDEFKLSLACRDRLGGVLLEVVLGLVMDAHRLRVHGNPARLDVRLLFHLGEDIFHGTGGQNGPIPAEKVVMHCIQRRRVNVVHQLCTLARFGDSNALYDVVWLRRDSLLAFLRLAGRGNRRIGAQANREAKHACCSDQGTQASR